MNPNRVGKVGSSFERLAYDRSHSSQYPPDSFDRNLAVVVPMRLSNDTVGADAEGYAIEHMRSLSISVNIRNESDGSFGRNAKRGDVGWTESDPGTLYIAASLYETVEDYHANYVSYDRRRANYAPEEVDANGRKIHVNSVTGEDGAMTYADGRQQHLTYDTGRQQHLTYDTGRKPPARFYDKETINAGSAKLANERTNREYDASGALVEKEWTSAEDEAILRGVEKHGSGRWAQIVADESDVLQHRTRTDVKDRHGVIAGNRSAAAQAAAQVPHRGKSASGRVKRKKWTEDEKNAVREGVRIYGEGNWVAIKKKFSKRLHDRTTEHIRDWWKRQTMG